ncbi:hypothetical protein Tco_0242131 [Tanacetum coccineum]
MAISLFGLIRSMAQQSEIAELQAADRRRQTVITDLQKRPSETETAKATRGGSVAFLDWVIDCATVQSVKKLGHEVNASFTTTPPTPSRRDPTTTLWSPVPNFTGHDRPGVTAVFGSTEYDRTGDDSHPSERGSLKEWSTVPMVERMETCSHKNCQNVENQVKLPLPKTMQEAIEMATELWIENYTLFAENRRKQEKFLKTLPGNNQNQHQNKRKKHSRAYAAGKGDVTRNHMEGTKPLVPV